MRAFLVLSASLIAIGSIACGSDSGTPPTDGMGAPDRQDSGPAAPGTRTDMGTDDAGAGSSSDVDASMGGERDAADSAAVGHDSGKAGHDSGPDTSTPGDLDAGDASGTFVVAPHPPFPLLVRGSASGGVITAPVIVPIFFAGYDHTAAIEDQLSTMGTVGTYWHDSVSEYGVGAYTYGTPVELTEAAPATAGHSSTATWLKNKLNGTHPEFGTPTAHTIYVVYYPSTTNLQGSCSDPATGGVGYGGYHDAVRAGNGAVVAFGVMAECANFGPTITNSLDMVTVGGSHEIIEAATDTQPGAGYASIDAKGFALDIFLQGNEENGDLCAVNHAFSRPASGYPYLLSRGWSNKAAAAGNLDPCQPALADQPYIGAAPVMPDMVTAEGSTGPGVMIPIGQTKTIDVELWSTAPTAPFTVAAKQVKGDNTLSFAWDKTTGINGDRLKLTITVNATRAGGYESFVVTANVNDEAKPIWAGIVKN